MFNEEDNLSEKILYFTTLHDSMSSSNYVITKYRLNEKQFQCVLQHVSVALPVEAFWQIFNSVQSFCLMLLLLFFPCTFKMEKLESSIILCLVITEVSLLLHML